VIPNKRTVDNHALQVIKALNGLRVESLRKLKGVSWKNGNNVDTWGGGKSCREGGNQSFVDEERH